MSRPTLLAIRRAGVARIARRTTAFTLLEVILAISLTGVVILLITTALHSLLHHVEASRWRVESSQLARGILNQIASDLRAARYYAPPKAAQSAEATEPESSDDTSSVGTSLQVLGVYGTSKELRIDRAAVWQWQHLSNEDQYDELEEASARDMPQTVRYFLTEGDTLQSDAFAAEGVPDEEASPNYAGLSRQRMATAAWISQSTVEDSEAPSLAPEEAELLAPEVIDLTFVYFDGKELLDKWDSAKQEGLPRAVKITVHLAREPVIDTTRQPPEDPEDLQRRLEDAHKYRLIVRLPRTRPRTDVPGPQRVEP